ncbi:cupin-like domain-containing protein [Marinihelvus fidelis]|uniref:Cupin-like domain-containing protein n=1 Tax=Marinihelvus fidelis TaxID=2613842 RepID=A0A5N0T5W6_9GAMM|nr:cupin-like domain-containing protein [Marinihelvus fidelis]KAA9130450.1 cupin-like domain-containing protein [Marinihelvus fidelis]
MRETRVLEDIAPEHVPWSEIVEEGCPVILKGLVRDWPLARTSAPREAASYLRQFYQGRPVTAFLGRPELHGRFGYTEDATRLDFQSERGDLGAYLERILELAGDAGAPSIYIGSTDVDQFLPGFRTENDLVLNHDMFEASPPMVGAWIGNRTTALAHHDLSYNVACCLVGRRRFSLFPPEQVANLYPGPLDPTPGGQVVTMADIGDPDFDRFPGLREALDTGEVADLEPGDALYYPALWWHQVSALEDFNIMVNYWWNRVPDFVDTPQTTLMHALLSLRDRPEPEKRAWRAMFDYYVFGPADRAGAHLPEGARGPLAPLDDMSARRLRALLQRKLNR